MTAVRSWILAVLLSAACGSSAQTTYYVDPQGSDKSDGRLAGNAWKSVERVNTARLRPGDRVLFKRGGTWWEELRPSASGRRGAPILFGAYGRGPAPVIDAGGKLEGWDDPERWTQVDRNLWQFRTPRYPGRLWLSGREYGTSGNNRGKGSTTANARYRWWGRGDDILEVYAEDNPARSYSSIEVSNEGRCAMEVRQREWLVFRDMTFRRGEICINVWDGDHLLFDSCRVLGGTAKFGLWLRGGSDWGEVRNCIFDREDTVMHAFEFAGEAGDGNGQDNIALQWANDWDIHHSVIANPGHDGIQISGELAEGQVWTSCRNRVHHNTVSMTGDYGRFFSTNAKGDPGYAAENEIFCNVVSNMTVQCQVLGSRNFVHDNLFTNYRKIPWDKLHYRSCVIDLSDYLTPAGQQTRIWNNTFVDCDAHAISITKGTRWASIRNNLIVNTGRLTGVGGRDFLDHVGIVIWPGATTDTIVGNVIWTGSKAPVVYQEPGWDSNRKVTVAWFNSQDGSFHNVIRGNASVDPRLTKHYQPSAVLPVKQVGRRQCQE